MELSRCPGPDGSAEVFCDPTRVGTDQQFCNSPWNIACPSQRKGGEHWVPCGDADHTWCDPARTDVRCPPRGEACGFRAQTGCRPSCKKSPCGGASDGCGGVCRSRASCNGRKCGHAVTADGVECPKQSCGSCPPGYGCVDGECAATTCQHGTQFYPKIGRCAGPPCPHDASVAPPSSNWMPCPTIPPNQVSPDNGEGWDGVCEGTRTPCDLKHAGSWFCPGNRWCVPRDSAAANVPQAEVVAPDLHPPERPNHRAIVVVNRTGEDVHVSRYTDPGGHASWNLASGAASLFYLPLRTSGRLWAASSCQRVDDNGQPCSEGDGNGCTLLCDTGGCSGPGENGDGDGVCTFGRGPCLHFEFRLAMTRAGEDSLSLSPLGGYNYGMRVEPVGDGAHIYNDARGVVGVLEASAPGLEDCPKERRWTGESGAVFCRLVEEPPKKLYRVSSSSSGEDDVELWFRGGEAPLHYAQRSVGYRVVLLPRALQ